MLLLGVVLLGVVVSQTDLSEVWQRLRQIGPWAAAGILAAFLLGHFALAASWQLTLPSLPAGLRTLWRIWRVLMVGSALDGVTPLAGLGGDPVKAILLKRHYGISYPEATASLVLARMTDLLAQVGFVSIGLFLTIRGGLLPAGWRAAAAAGLFLFAVMIGLFLLVQTQRGFSRLRGWLERRPLGQRLSERAVGALDAVHEVEDRLVAFYGRRRRRFLASVGCAFLEWTSNAAAVWVAVNALGHPIGPADALVIEGFVALVRTTLFFVPGDLGTQEAALVMICSAVGASPETGLALAAIRRGRDLLWILGGLAIGGIYSLREAPRLAAEASAEQAALEASRTHAPEAYADASAAGGRSARFIR
jgi:uncharacterized protein (TIRG00374 family)